MKHATTNIQENLVGFSELSYQEMTKLNGGFWLIIAGVLGAMAAAATLYRFGYDMVDKAYETAEENAKK